MKRSRSPFPKFLMIILFIFAFIVPISFIVMALWNNILAEVLHVTVINFWQALGIFALSKILFGGFPVNGPWGHRERFRKDELRKKLFNLSPEEQAKFKRDWQGRFDRGQASPAPEEPTAL